ncbi:MAG: hypothetical protein KTR18_01560 [Acidiferrobacterales bacterium]|nr:hypothetical protein [Acidiferrobacterales bacterium]
MNKIDKVRRKTLTALGAGLLTGSVPGVAMSKEAMELVVDHVMFPLYFNNQFLDVAEEVWEEMNMGKVTRGKQNAAFKAVYLHSKSFYVEYLSNVKAQPYWSNAIYVVVPKDYWGYYRKPALVTEHFLIPEFGCGYQLMSPNYPHLNSDVSTDVEYDDLVILISAALEEQITNIAGKRWVLPGNNKIRVHTDLKHVHDIVVINGRDQIVAPLLQPNPILRQYL